MLQSEYTDYISACELFKVETLVMRRKNMCLKFAKKEFLRESSIFIKFQQKRYTRLSEKTLVQEINCNSNKYFNSSIPYLSRLLNNDKQWFTCHILLHYVWTMRITNIYLHYVQVSLLNYYLCVVILYHHFKDACICK